MLRPLGRLPFGTGFVSVAIVAVAMVVVPVRVGEASGALSPRSVVKFVICDSERLGISKATSARSPAGFVLAPDGSVAKTLLGVPLGVGPAGPVEPVGPVGPVEPVGPVVPVVPVGPVGPAGPVDPVSPVLPVSPFTP